MGETLEYLDDARENVYKAMDAMYETLNDIDNAAVSMDEVPEPVEGLESRVYPHQSRGGGMERRVSEDNRITLPQLGAIAAIIAIIAAVSFSGMRKYLPGTEPKKEYVVSYESPYVRQLADSALKNVAHIQRPARLYEMDKDRNEVITEDEIVSYVRENYAKLR